MVDYQSRAKCFSSGYTPATVRLSTPSLKELKHESSRQLSHRIRNTPLHDCRSERMKEWVHNDEFGALLLSHGLKQTCEDVAALNTFTIKESPAPKAEPDKLLVKKGTRGHGEEQFFYPRGVTTNGDGDVFVADTGNHRIQIISQCGVYKGNLGSKGSNPGEFIEPVGVTILPTGDLAVADKKNKRIQIFNEELEFKREFSTESEPCYVACDYNYMNYNIFVSDFENNIKIFSDSGKLKHSFSLGQDGKKIPVHFGVNEDKEIVVLDATNNSVKTYNYTGKLLREFTPHSNNAGLAITANAICLTPIGEVVVSDSLNHIVNMYSRYGQLIQQLAGPLDDTGSIQAICIGSEGHLVATVFSIVGNHCVKYFRYMECMCHYVIQGGYGREDSMF